MAPGVVVTTTVRGGGSTPLAANSGQFFVVGLSNRGRTNEAVLVRGLADFVSEFGNRTGYSYLYDTVKSYFDEGGEQAYVARVVGTGATVGDVTLDNREATPNPAVKFAARSEGVWSGDLSVSVEAGTAPNTVRVTLVEGGKRIEGYNNLSSPAEIVSAFAKSNVVSATDLGATATGADALPALGTFSLSAGDDDRATITTDSYIAALDRFSSGLGTGAVAIPGLGEAVHVGLIEHATTNRRIALLSHDVDATTAELLTAAASIDSDAAGLFAPWVRTPDASGVTRAIPPEGFVAAARYRAHNEVGPWRVPAGINSVANVATGVVVEYTNDEANALDEGKVSVIKRVNNGVRLYGWRSLSNDTENFGYLNGRDLLNFLTIRAEGELEQYVFGSVDSKGHLLSAINGSLVGIVEPIRIAGGLYEHLDDNGEQVDPGYLVETGSSINSTESLANNEVKARLSVRVSPVGALISLTIVKVGVLQGF